MESYTIKGHGITKPITVKSYTRAPKAKVSKRSSKRMYAAKRNALVGIIVAVSYVATFYAGAVSTFTDTDWTNIDHLSIHEINQVLPLMSEPQYAAAAALPVIVEGKVMEKPEFCAWARKTGKTKVSFDVATYCL